MVVRVVGPLPLILLLYVWLGVLIPILLLVSLPFSAVVLVLLWRDRTFYLTRRSDHVYFRCGRKNGFFRFRRRQDRITEGPVGEIPDAERIRISMKLDCCTKVCFPVA